MGDSEAPLAGDTQLMIDGGPGYPVDGIKDSISCELHVQMKNMSIKVAVGYAIPSTPDARWNDREIPDGYAKVGVDEILTGFHSICAGGKWEGVAHSYHRRLVDSVRRG